MDLSEEVRTPNMLTALEGAHAFHVSTFGEVEHLRVILT
jgi:hypothetical protein